MMNLVIKFQEYVAPYVGAWIETDKRKTFSDMRVVAPYVGAWIETKGLKQQYQYQSVAPYVGAWIETDFTYLKDGHVMSHPTWVRGLKLTGLLLRLLHL